MGLLSGIGKAGVSTAKFLGKATNSLANGFGKSIVNYGDNIITNAVNNPLKTIATLGAAGTAGYMIADLDKHPNPTKVAGSAMLGAASLTALASTSSIGALGAGAIAGLGATIGGSVIKLGEASLKNPTNPITFSNMSDLKLNGLGKGLVFGSALYEGLGKAANKFVQNRMGQHDGMMRTSTPIIPQNINSNNRMPSYANNGGATGDLVFSMYNNR